MNNLLKKLIRKFIVIIFIVVVFNFIKADYSSAFIGIKCDTNKENSSVNALNNSKYSDNLKRLLSEPSAELAGGKIVIRIISVDEKDKTVTIKAEIENNSDYVVKKSLYSFHLIDSTKKRMQLKPIDNNSFGGDIAPNSKQTFYLIFTGVDLSAKPMKLKGELFIPDPRVRDDRFSLDIS